MDPSSTKVSVISAPLHLPVPCSAKRGYSGAEYPMPPEELTLRAVQFQQACWDAGRPARRAAAVSGGMFENEFEKREAEMTPGSTTIRNPATAQWRDVSARSGGEVFALVTHTYEELLQQPLGAENIALIPGGSTKYTSASLSQSSLHCRKFDRNYENQTHQSRRDTSFLHSPFSTLSVHERANKEIGDRVAAAAAVAAPSPIPPSDAVLNSPLKRRMADVHAAAAASSAAAGASVTALQELVSPTTGSSKSTVQDPFALAASVDALRNWDAVKTPCGFKLITCSTVCNAKWAVSEQGTPYAFVQVPFTSPPVWDWVRVNSGHVDPESVAGRCTRKSHAGSFLMISCGNAKCVWGVTQDALDYGRCVVRIGFTQDTPNGTDWLNMSDHIMDAPPSSSSRHKASLQRSSSQFADRSSLDVEQSRFLRHFEYVSVGADGSVWAIVVEPGTHGEAINNHLGTDDANAVASSSFSSSVWIREGAVGSSLGSRWQPLSLSRETFPLQRPYDESSRPKYAHFLRLCHVWCNKVFAIIAETPEHSAQQVGAVYERCGITPDNLTGDLWRKIILDPSPLCVALSLPVALTRASPPPAEEPQTLVLAMSVAGDGSCWMIDSAKKLLDATATLQRSQAHPSAIIIHDRFAGVENYRDTTLDGDLFDGDRTAGFSALIERWHQEKGGAEMELSASEWKDVLQNIRGVLDLASLHAVLPQLGHAWNASPEYNSVKKCSLVGLEGTGSSFLLHFTCHLVDNVPPLDISVQTVALNVFDPVALRRVTTQVAETVRWCWQHSASTAMHSVLPSTSLGTLGKDAAVFWRRLVGVEFEEQLDHTMSLLSQPLSLSRWLQLHENRDDAVVIASLPQNISFVESVVHRDILPDLNGIEKLKLADPSLRPLQQMQCRRLILRSKMFIAGALRDVSVVSASPLGIPSPAVTVFSSDFDWCCRNRAAVLDDIASSSRLRVVRLSSLVSGVHHSYMQRPDNTIFRGFPSAMITSPSAVYSSNPNSTSRVMVDVLDLIETVCRVLNWNLEALSLSNQRAMISPREHRFQSLRDLRGLPTSTIAAADTALRNGDETVVVPAGMSFICATSMTNFRACITQRLRLEGSSSAAHPATIQSFMHLVQLCFCNKNNNNNGRDDDATLLMAATISGSGSSVSSQKREAVFSTATVAGFDLLDGLCQRHSTAVSKDVSSFLRLELLQPELRITTASEIISPSDHYTLNSYWSGPAAAEIHTAEERGRFSVKRIEINTKLRFDVERLSAFVLENLDDPRRSALETWLTRLPPSFTAEGSIVLWDNTSIVDASVSREHCGEGVLVFIGKVAMSNWSDPAGLGKQVELFSPTVEVLFKINPAAVVEETSATGLSSSLDVVEIRFHAQGVAHGVLFEHGTLSYPILGSSHEKRNGDTPLQHSHDVEQHASDVFGPSLFQYQRRCLSLEELLLSARASSRCGGGASDNHGSPLATTTTPPCNNNNSTSIISMERVLGQCCRMYDVRAYATASHLIAHPSSWASPACCLGIPRQGFFSRAHNPPSVVQQQQKQLSGAALRSGQHVSLKAESVSLATAGTTPFYLIIESPSTPSASSSSSVDRLRIKPYTAERSHDAWVLNKVVAAADAPGTGEATFPKRLFQSDPILRHGDTVSVFHVSTSTWLAENEDAHWVIEIICFGGGEDYVDGWTPLTASTSFRLVNAASGVPFHFDDVSSDANNHEPSSAAVDTWQAIPCWGPSAMVIDGVSSLMFGRPASVSVDLTTTSTAAVCTVSGTLLEPLTLGGRSETRACAISVTDLDLPHLGCSFLASFTREECASMKEEQQQKEHGGVEVDKAYDDAEETVAASQALATSKTSDDGGVETSTENITFHLRNACLHFLGAELPCVGSSLGSGVSGLRLDDAVLHIVGQGCLSQFHKSLPSLPAASLLHQVVSSTTPPASAPTICSRHGDALHLTAAIEAVLFPTSILSNPVPAMIGVVQPPCDGGDHCYHYTSEHARTKFEACISCEGCVAHVESVIRALLQWKARQTVKECQATVDRLTPVIAAGKNAIRAIDEEVTTMMDIHEHTYMAAEADAKAELAELNARLQKVIRREELFEENKAAKKPHKALMYAQDRIALQNERREIEGELKKAQAVLQHQQSVLSQSIDQISTKNLTMTTSYVVDVNAPKCALDTASRLISVLQHRGGSTVVPLDELTAWTVKQIRIRGWAQPTASPPTSACVEVTLDVFRGSSGRIPVSQEVSSITPMTALLSPLANTTSSHSPSHSRLLPGGHTNASSQTNEVIVWAIPLGTFDREDRCCNALQSVELLTEFVLHPVANKMLGSFLGDALKTRNTPISASEIEMIAAQS